MLFFISTLHVHFLLSFDHRNVRKNIGTGNLIINKKLLLVILDPTVFRQIIKRLRIVSFQRIVLRHTTPECIFQTFLLPASCRVRKPFKSTEKSTADTYKQQKGQTEIPKWALPFSVIKPFPFFSPHSIRLLKS